MSPRPNPAIEALDPWCVDHLVAAIALHNLARQLQRDGHATYAEIGRAVVALEVPDHLPVKRPPEGARAVAPRSTPEPTAPRTPATPRRAPATRTAP